MPTAGSSVTSALDPWALQDRNSAVDSRYAMASMVMPTPGSSTIAYRSGVFAAGDAPASTMGTSSHLGMKATPGSGMNILVNPGNCIIDTPSNGPYMCVLDSQKTLAIAARSATLNRIDLIMARVYDDQNSAIGSPVNTRKFDLQVWTGDGVSGTPSVPSTGTGFPAAGWIPIASVNVAKGSSTSIAAADITDLRGPGLVARGGVRMLFGEDAKITSAQFLAPGAYPGDTRWVHGNPFPLQVFGGANTDSDIAGWRGVLNELHYQAVPVGAGTIWTYGSGSVKELCRVTVPDPGTPYVVEATGRLNGIISGGTSVELRVSLDAANGELINFNGYHNFGNTIDKALAMTVPAIPSGPYTGAKDIVLNAFVRESPNGSTGIGYAPGSGGQHVLSVKVKPATIPPTKVWK